MSTPARTMEDSVIDRVRWLSGGGREIRVSIVHSPEQVGLHVTRQEVNSEFGPMTQTIYHVSVMPNWEEAVGREGPGLLYGDPRRGNEGPHVTLDARLVRKVGRFSIYQAVWACRDRESQVTTRRGYIARGHQAWDDIGGFMAFGHADTPERALRIARWRLAYWPRRERWRLRLWPLTERLRVLARKPRSYARRFWLLAREPALIAEWLWLFRYHRSRRASGGEAAEDEAAELRERRLILAGKHPFRKARVNKRGRPR